MGWTMISVDFIRFHLVSKIVDIYDSTFSVALKFWNWMALMLMWRHTFFWGHCFTGSSQHGRGSKRKLFLYLKHWFLYKMQFFPRQFLKVLWINFSCLYIADGFLWFGFCRFGGGDRCKPKWGCMLRFCRLKMFMFKWHVSGFVGPPPYVFRFVSTKSEPPTPRANKRNYLIVINKQVLPLRNHHWKCQSYAASSISGRRERWDPVVVGFWGFAARHRVISHTK